MNYLSNTPIQHKRVLLRTDYNVSLTPTHTIADDNRIRASLPTIKKLLEGHNKLIILSHLGRPKGKEMALSLDPVRKKLQEYLPDNRVTLVSDFKTNKHIFENQTSHDILLLENIRFFPGEEQNDTTLAMELSSLGDIYVNDAFSVDHRKAASTVGLPQILPSYAGLSLEAEYRQLSALLKNPQHPFVALVGGGKISTKLSLLHNLLQKVDTLLLGGGLATTCLQATGINVGKSISEPSLLTQAKKLVDSARDKLLLPVDVIVEAEDKTPHTRIVLDIQPNEIIRDIGPQTIAQFSEKLARAHTILWNGPVGFFEVPPYSRGTDEMYQAMSTNAHATKIVGGGDSLAALSKYAGFEKHFTHVSTGGGAMLEFLETGTLPGLDALTP